MDFDEDRLYYSHQALQQQEEGENGNANNAASNNADDTVNMTAVRRHFREFLRNYRQGPHRYLYRDRLLRMHRRISGDDNNLGLIDSNGSKLDIDLAHVGEYDAALLGLLLSSPAKVLPAMELAAEDALKSLLYDIQRNTATNEDDPIQGPDAAAAAATSENADGETQPQRDNAMNGITHIQILLKGNLALTPLRSIKAQHMNRLIKCPGIILSASPPRSRATQLLVRCSRCLDTQILSASENDGSIPLPRRCGGDDAQQCGNFPYSVVPDESHFCDRQSLKLQESPETIPTGEMPRSVQMSVERSLVDKAPPGTRVQVLCIPSLYNAAASGTDSVKSVYLKVVGLSRDLTHGESATFSPREEEAFRLLSKRSDVYDILSRSVAPSISGSYTVDIKKAIVAMLFGGTRKRLPDGVRLRGDINVLLLGDPSTAKSQFLKFTSKVAPVGIYTSGKGSSAAGLTASVVKDARGEFYLEGGAMVLADGGIVAIDEFDKMRPQDRVAIHEAMEQQTISVAKAGITTVLNSRSSVLAAANPVFGRYDDLKSASENIDLMTTILSRFDLIFLVRDVREEDRDRMICKHVMGVHIQNSRGDGGFTNRRNLQSRELEEDDPLERNTGGSLAANSSEAIAENIMRVATTGVGELDIPAMKKYVQYCKTRCAPRLSEQAGDVLASSYVKIRDDVRKRSIDQSGTSGRNDDTQSVIPITVRQLEALVRLSESLAKMRLDPDVQPEDVAEALRLFRVSTMAANSADSNGGNSNNPAIAAPLEEMERSEAFLKSRLAIGTIVNKQRLVEEAAAQGYNAMAVSKAIMVMAMRGEVQERNQGRLMKRIK